MTHNDQSTDSIPLKLAVLLLAVVALKLPINDIQRYATLVVAGIIVFAGPVTTRSKPWLTAFAIMAAALIFHAFFPAPRIEEGHNIFLADGDGGALARELPAGAYNAMRADFDARYPIGKRCGKGSVGCWRDQGFPDHAFAFSADSVFDRPVMSRRVSTISLDDPTWARISTINESRYNWGIDSDIQRNGRKDHWWQFAHPFKMSMPFYVAYIFPEQFIGSRLCWTGTVLWESDNKNFARQQNASGDCRTIESKDIGRTIFGLAIAAPLKMSLEPTLGLRAWQWLDWGLPVVAVIAALMLLARPRRAKVILTGTLVAGALAIVFLNDASFIGGIRPFDGGDDGIFYESKGRDILRFLLAGDYYRALEGGESVYYYGGPGLRYLRALEHVIFGDTFFGYLSLMLALPLVVFALYCRFFGSYWGLALAVVFVAVPIGSIFGTSFFHYAKWSARGFADPAAALSLFAGILVLIGRADRGFRSAFGAGLLFALALWIRPNLAPGAAVFLTGAALAALWQRQFTRVVGLCIGFAPVFGMAFHNWYFGNALVLFSSNATITEALPMPPSAYAGALHELLRLDLRGPDIARGLLQWARWLAGPSESFIMIPLHALAIAILIRVALTRRYEGWSRLIAAMALGMHPVAWFYLSADRYYYAQWFLTSLVFLIWARNEFIPWLRKCQPSQWERAASSNGITRLKAAFDRYARACGITPTHQA